MLDHRLGSLGAHSRPLKRFGGGDFVNEEVGTLRVPNQILGDASVSR